MKPFKKYESKFDRKAVTSVRNELRRKKEAAKYEDDYLELDENFRQQNQFKNRVKSDT